MSVERKYDFTGLKVAVIDDSKMARQAAETLLSRVGCQVITAADGFEALSKVYDTRPDIIIVDIVMPRLDGYQVCAVIKSNLHFKHIPVILLSSKDGLFDRAKGRVVGANDYVTKPFTGEELFAAIAGQLPDNTGLSVDGNKYGDGDKPGNGTSHSPAC